MAEYHVENFGCRANQADGEVIGSELRRYGLSAASHPAAADVIVVNTCSVTAQADRTARAFLRRVRRENPSARILVTGCYAQRAPEEVAALPGVHAVVGNSHKALVQAFAVQEAVSGPSFVPLHALWPASASSVPVGIHADDSFAHSMLTGTGDGSTRGQTRPNLKVQDGCGNRCSFCVIPATRGHSRSLHLETCLRSINALAAGGVVELVLSGINLGRWGRDLTPSSTLEALVTAVLEETSLQRLRLSSIEPMDWTPRLLSLFRNQVEPFTRRLARHAHLPLQSGSDAILRAMHRRYRPWHYAEKLSAIREHMPDAAIGADVMAGFPGETEALFEESFAFIAAQSFTYLHLFPFSARPGTPAWNLFQQHPVPPQIVAERMARLRQLIDGKNRAFRESFIGRELPAVTLETPESEHRDGFTRALSDNFIELRLKGRLPSNQSVWASIAATHGDGLTGSVA